MKSVKILGNDGNTVKIESNDEKPVYKDSHVVYVTYGVTPKSEIMKHLKNNDFMICLYHMSGYNLSYRVPMVSVTNSHFPGNEYIDFITPVNGGDLLKISYSVADDSWTED